MDPEAPQPKTRWVRPKGGRSRRKLKAKIAKLKDRVEELNAELRMLRMTMKFADQNIFKNPSATRGEIRLPIPNDWHILESRVAHKNGQRYRILTVQRKPRSTQDPEE